MLETRLDEKKEKSITGRAENQEQINSLSPKAKRIFDEDQRRGCSPEFAFKSAQVQKEVDLLSPKAQEIFDLYYFKKGGSTNTALENAKSQEILDGLTDPKLIELANNPHWIGNPPRRILEQVNAQEKINSFTDPKLIELAKKHSNGPTPRKILDRIIEEKSVIDNLDKLRAVRDSLDKK